MKERTQEEQVALREIQKLWAGHDRVMEQQGPAVFAPRDKLAVWKHVNNSD